MTAEELLSKAKGWKRPGLCSRRAYALVDPTVHFLATKRGWTATEITDQIIASGGWPADRRAALYAHVNRLCNRLLSTAS